MSVHTSVCLSIMLLHHLIRQTAWLELCGWCRVVSFFRHVTRVWLCEIIARWLPLPQLLKQWELFICHESAARLSLERVAFKITVSNLTHMFKHTRVSVIESVRLIAAAWQAGGKLQSNSGSGPLPLLLPSSPVVSNTMPLLILVLYALIRFSDKILNVSLEWHERRIHGRSPRSNASGAIAVPTLSTVGNAEMRLSTDVSAGGEVCASRLYGNVGSSCGSSHNLITRLRQSVTGDWRDTAKWFFNFAPSRGQCMYGDK